MNMRRKPSSQGNGGGFNQNRQQKPRFQNGGGGGNGGGSSQYNRPRKNYGQLREKYLAQARDALASGDRVLAENYYQHADHCYRMLMEENANRPQRPQHNPQVQQQEGEEAQASNEESQTTEEDLTPPHAGALPSFITGGFSAAAAAPAEAPAAQDWEERDQEQQ